MLFASPQIPPNTGNAIRMCAGTGAALHLAEPLGFNFEEKHVRRAGLDYHDLAEVHVHASFDAALTELTGISLDDGDAPADATAPRVFAFTAHADRWHTDIDYREGDVLLFGPEPTGLSEEALTDPRITQLVRIPMLPGRRSMNLSNAAAVAAYEAWRQMGFPGGE
ncbi:tRNA (cytidine(34)-2'-O)-methyltransferase [uncultured Corynebacterium sp.]|uniref:tRNA (cytidine(34)-2'-O)-methyltransferase n=1 Tax=uncultured Corynebacterium sp. TaxID=159447 RepID=UPI0025D7B4F9|nr:TrmH family RNA methyltransferase [uncultured Corynebacterium sp.]